MYARVARFEGATAQALEASAAGIREQAAAEEGPPPGVPAKKFLLLHDTAGGKALAITLFENDDDYREGDATLETMSPPGEGMGQRVAVDKYELVVDLDA